jgi:uncharacterized protein YjbI with pentapeptide repeats
LSNTAVIDPRRSALSSKIAAFCAAAVLFLPVTGRTAETAPPLPQMDRAAMTAAIMSNQPIVGRTILGEDLAAVLKGLVASAKECDGAHGLKINGSVVKGAVDLSGGSADSIIWLPIAVTINNTSVTDPITIARMGLSCPWDLSDTTFNEVLTFNAVTTADTFVADRAVFKNGIEALGVSWQSSVSFKRTQFFGNAEFASGQGPKGGPILSVFSGNADFDEAVFHRGANFLASKFSKKTDFRYAQFLRDAQFSNTTIGPGSTYGGPFYMSEFLGQGIFRNTHFVSLKLYKTRFQGDLDFHRADGMSLTLQSVDLKGAANFDDAHLASLEINGFSGSMTVEGDAIFRRASIMHLALTRVSFKKSVDLQEADLGSRVLFTTVHFGGDLHLEDATFGSPDPGDDDGTADGTEGVRVPPQFLMKDVTTSGGIYADASQLLVSPPWWAIWRENTPRFTTDQGSDDDDQSRPEKRRLWRELERAFQKAENLQMKNYAAYMVSSLDEADQSQPARTYSVLSRWFWGYGVRPMRVLFWAAIMVVAFACLYATQLRSLGEKQPPLRRIFLRAQHALVFSARTAWELRFGYQNSRSTAFKCITLVESVLGKALLACFAYALTQTSPLLSDLMKKLLP